jgi:anaerobic selenocysteine-containing dehydrogenase
VRLVTLHPQAHSLSRHADLWLRPQPGEEAHCIAQLTAALINPPAEPQELYAHAAHLLQGPGPRVVVVGAQFLTHPANQVLLPGAAALAEHLQAALVVLPEEGNLAGALLLGATLLAPAAEPAVRYCIGETAPGETLGQTFRIYQNLYPPNPADPADLLLPAAAFSETSGSLVDAGGLVQAFQPAVPPPGAAEPAWQTLCRIARQLGSPGFDFANAADIQAELAARLGGYELHQRVSQRVSAVSAQAPGNATALPYPTAHTYLGFPLSQWVEGLTMLVAEEEGCHV